MDNKNTNRYQWDTLDVTVLVDPIEIIAYHLYRYLNKVEKKESVTKQDLNIVKSYLRKESKKEVEVESCFRM
jgi:hypothetical protein